MDGVESDILSITTGVPQGSILGPLFILYINDIANSSNLFNFMIYADDTTLSITITLEIVIKDTTVVVLKLNLIGNWQA